MEIDTKHCEGCPLDGLTKPCRVIGSTDARYMVVVDTPSVHNAGRGRLLPEKSMALLGEALDAERFDKEDFVFVPQIRCAHDADQYTTKQKRDIKKHCREHFLDDVYDIKPEVILPLGKEPASQVFGKSVKINSVRGIATYLEEHGATAYPILNPGQVVMYPQHEPVFRADIANFGRLIDNGMDAEKAAAGLLGDYEFVDDLQFLIDMQSPILYFDTENTGLEFYKVGPDDAREYDPAVHGKAFEPSAAILTMQFCVEPGKAYMLVWDHPEAPMPLRKQKRIKEQLRLLLCNPKTRVVGQKAKYDCTYVREVLGINYKIGGDTLMMAALLDENALSKGQDVLVKRYVPEMAGYADHFNAKVDKSRMWEVPLSELLGYGCGDVDSGLRMYYAMWDLIKDDWRLVAHYRRVSLPGLNTFAALEPRGIGIDPVALDEFQKFMEVEVERQYESLIGQVPRSIKRKHIDKGLKFSRPDFVRDVLFYHKDGFRLKPKVFTKTTEKLQASMRVPSVSTKDHLPYFYDDCSFTFELAEHIKDTRLLDTNVRGFQNKYIHDGLVRPEYSLSTTVTGRTSSENPNGQNFPKRGNKATAYRRIFVPPPGYYVMEADLSQAELRISADMANDPTMLRIYREGGDIHIESALIAMGIDRAAFDLLPKAEKKLARTKAKAINFGFIYGMGWRKFIGYAKTQYGVEFTEDEAQRIREAFFAKYSRLMGWHESMRAFAREHQFVRSYSGRIRHLPMILSDEDGVVAEAGRQAINSPVQEFGSSLGVMAMGRLHEEIDDRYLAPVAFVHDAIYCYVPYAYLDWGARTLKRYMQTNPIEEWFDIKMKCPIVSDVSFGLNFGDTLEMPDFALDKPYDYSQFWDKDEKSGIIVPKQSTPPNNGRRAHPPYSWDYAAAA